MKNRLANLLIFSAVLILFAPQQGASSFDPPLRTEALVFRGSDFMPQDGDGMALAPNGLTLEKQTNSGNYTSPSIQAPIPFNAIVPRWVVDLPETANMQFFLRSGKSEGEWGNWQELHASSDWTEPEKKSTVGNMAVVPASDNTHRYVQYRVKLSQDDMLADPLLRELKLTFIDSTAGPTAEEMIAAQEQLNRSEDTNPAAIGESQDGYPKPFVISRAVWCTDPRCDYSDGLEYQPVTHLVLHHTVTSSDGDSAAVVRAIWLYHAFENKWGDIGYNFLVDTKGLIFEGHLGGDDVVGTHASGANSGSMGLALIGGYSYLEPPAVMVESAVDMFAWKADQRNINVFEASKSLPNIKWGLPHVMGHRDVHGTTQCPGDKAHDLIPAIRDEVAARLGQESAHIHVDELSSAFTKSNTNWYEPIYQCGHNTHSWYTWSTTEPAESTNWGEWRPEVPFSGRYQIDVHIPYCNTGQRETGGAKYTIQDADGIHTVVLDQDANVGLWTSLGEYELLTSEENVIHLTDLTTTDDGRGVWFDAMRLLALEELPTSRPLAPADNEWLDQREVLFEWLIENPEEVSQTSLQVATDDQFQDVIVTKEWPSAVEGVPHTFDRDYATLYWRVVLTSKAGNNVPSAAARFSIDSEPPVSSVKSLTWLEFSKVYWVSWNGNDALNAIDRYSIEYRLANGEAGDWQPWLSDVSAQTAFFTPPDTQAVYEFRSQAVDTLGNVEAAHETADIDTGQAISLSYAIILPVIRQ